MISNRPQEELRAIGAQLRSAYVLAQGDHTLNLVRSDGPVAEAVGEAFLSEIEAALDKLKTVLKDPEIAAAESKDPALQRGEILEEAKIWRRAVVSRVKAAALRGIAVPEGLAQVDGGGDLAQDLERRAELIEKALPRLRDVGLTPELVKKGRELAATPEKAAPSPEVPEKLKELSTQKALVYLAVKQINLLAAGIHAEDADGRKRYNMDRLHRATRHRRIDPPAAASPGRPAKRKERPRSELLQLGARFRTSHLLAQARHTMSLLATDPEAAAIASAATELKSVIAKLERAGDSLPPDETREIAKLRRRKLVNCARAALLRGVDIPRELGRMQPRSGDTTGLLADVERARPHLDKLAAFGIRERDLTPLFPPPPPKKLSKKEQDFCVLRGRTYLFLKEINFLGRSVHAEIGEASDYNLDLLYRAARRR